MEGGCVTQKKRNDEYARLTAMTDHDRPNISVELLISFLVRRRQVLLVGIDDEHGQQAGGFGLTRVCADAMMIARHFVEAVASAVCFFRSIVDLAPYRTLQDRCVDEGGVWMGVSRR
jgi:hypothetical protein